MIFNISGVDRKTSAGWLRITRFVGITLYQLGFRDKDLALNKWLFCCHAQITGTPARLCCAASGPSGAASAPAPPRAGSGSMASIARACGLILAVSSSVRAAGSSRLRRRGW
ncbi:MAG: hypothetical protein KBG29_02935 [Pseudomonadales bacterium]|nr:hypothetical protein [Pseudomonadales bacterium]MBP9032821.1 hypothetical protein [Pseudomonadales bacterium]